MTANRYRAEREIAIGGETLTLRGDFEAIVKIEARTRGLRALAVRAGDGDMTLVEMAAVIEEATRHAGRTWAKDEAARAIHDAGAAIQASAAIYHFLVDAMTGGQARPLPAAAMTPPNPPTAT